MESIIDDKVLKEDNNDDIDEKDEIDKVDDIESNTEQIKKKKKKTKKKTETQKRNLRLCLLAKSFNLDYDPIEMMKIPFSGFQNNSEIVNLGNWNTNKSAQSFPPSIPSLILFPNNSDLPTGVNTPYSINKDSKFNDPDYIKRDQLYEEKIYCLRRAAEVHREVRKYAQTFFRPGVKLVDAVKRLESTLSYLTEKDGIIRGQAFPTGCSLNNVAAHYTPNYGDNTVLTKNDVLKLDFGVHFNGYLIDSAFTIAFDHQYDNLLSAVKEATNTGIRMAGIDVRLCDIGEGIQEVMESHEVEIKGKTFPIYSVRNLCGHTIEKYRVHAGKSVPIVKGGPETKMEEGEIYAIETFGTTGKGIVREDGECSHYMKDYDEKRVALKHPKAKNLLSFIDKNFGTLAFCRRWLDDGGEEGHIIALKELVDKGVVNTYPPLCDVSGSYVAQYEHTLLLKPSGKEVMSIGEDY